MNQIPVHITPPKPFKTYPQLVALMQQRGIIVKDVARAERKLSQVGYYRLSGFWYPLYGSMPFPGWLKFYNGSSLVKGSAFFLTSEEPKIRIEGVQSASLEPGQFD